jgi:putative endonuclease
VKGFVYILTNKNNNVLYTGVTSELAARIEKHKEKANHKSFISRYNASKLVYFEAFNSMGEAIKREKQIKAGSKKRKVDLIIGINPEWRDPFNDPGMVLGDCFVIPPCGISRNDTANK